MTIVSIVMALGPPPPIDPNAPPFIQEFQKGANGPQAVVIQSIFIFVNLLALLNKLAVSCIEQGVNGVPCSLKE
jgi:hypothetical protein